jgi:DNA modification methylase
MTEKPKLEIVYRPLDWFIPYEKNPRKNEPAVPKIQASIREFGFAVPILSRSSGHIVDGHLRHKGVTRMPPEEIAARGLGELPTILCDGWTEAQIKAFRYMVNRSGSWADWDSEQMRLDFIEFQKLNFDLTLTGFDLTEAQDFLAYNPDENKDDPPAMEIPTNPVTRTGDLWTLGKHRILCGDGTVGRDVARLLQDFKPDLILTDPPYCSGGFQEADRHTGSVGTNAVHELVANDQLSTRGYLALMKTVLNNFNAPSMYVFTDWRQWVNLFDLAEASGYGVRNMIVWNKGTPGMGRGWRAQHEIVMFGTKARIKFDGHKAQGNVIDAKRTGNEYHTTEKPISLLSTILHVSDFAHAIVDPFLGSGSTLLACDQAGRICRGLELKPAYVDVAIARWEAQSGLKATLTEVVDATSKSGLEKIDRVMTFEEVRAERLGN